MFLIVFRLVVRCFFSLYLCLYLPRDKSIQCAKATYLLTQVFHFTLKRGYCTMKLIQFSLQKQVRCNDVNARVLAVTLEIITMSDWPSLALAFLWCLDPVRMLEGKWNNIQHTIIIWRSLLFPPPQRTSILQFFEYLKIIFVYITCTVWEQLNWSSHSIPIVASQTRQQQS